MKSVNASKWIDIIDMLESDLTNLVVLIQIRVRKEERDLEDLNAKDLRLTLYYLVRSC